MEEFRTRVNSWKFAPINWILYTINYGSLPGHIHANRSLSAFSGCPKPNLRPSTSRVAKRPEGGSLDLVDLPAIKRLGTSPISIRYAIEDEKQAGEYWNHPILGMRLRECSALIEKSVKTPSQIFNTIDTLKYQSSRSLFRKFENSSANWYLFHITKCFNAILLIGT